jgi:hypothetical protein
VLISAVEQQIEGLMPACVCIYNLPNESLMETFCISLHLVQIGTLPLVNGYIVAVPISNTQHDANNKSYHWLFVIGKFYAMPECQAFTVTTAHVFRPGCSQ